MELLQSCIKPWGCTNDGVNSIGIRIKYSATKMKSNETKTIQSRLLLSIAYMYTHGNKSVVDTNTAVA